MFEHLISQTRAKARKNIPLHHHISVAAVVLGVLVSVVAVNLNLPRFHTISKATARDSQVRLRLVTDAEDRSIVGPLVLEPILTLEARVAQAEVALTTLRFGLDGVYDISGISGITLYIDGVQIGEPVLPDEQGYVSYSFETVSFDVGTHRIVAKLSTTSDLGIAHFRATFSPERDVVFTDVAPWQVHTQLPYSTELMHVVSQGTLGAFARSKGDISRHAPRFLYLYGEGEDFEVVSLEIAADRDITGTRIDVFQGETFIATGQFFGTEASIMIPDSLVRTMRGQAIPLLLLMSPDTVSLGRLAVTSITAHGITSGAVSTLADPIELLP